MTQNNILLISGAILPVIITVIIGYISGKRKDFNWQQAGDINKIVMLYALPLSIFSNMVMTPRHIVMTMGPVAVAIILALILSFVIPLLVARYLFRRDLALSTLQALAIGSPAVPFIGTSVLAFLFGTVSASLITVSSITQNVFQLPLVMILMSVATGDKSQHISFGARVVNAIKQPVVWSPVIALIIVPILFALFGGFAPKIGPMMLEGITKLAPTGVMLMFAILYFALMIDSGLFDPAVRKILKLVKGDPLKISVGTAVLALVVSLDGDGATTYMICVAAMLPLYSRIGMSPRIMAGLIILAGGVMNMTPWGGPTARAASALHVDPSAIFVPMIPAMAAGVLAILVIAYFYGKRERARLGELHLVGDEIDHSEISVSQFPDARRPKLIWFNGALTLALMCTLIAGLLPLPVLFMVAFSIAMIVNYPCLQQQKDRVAAHAGSVLAVVSLIFAAGLLLPLLRKALTASESMS